MIKRIFLITIACLGWFALIAQFYLLINSKVAPVPELLIRFFSYFTIDTNLIVALCCSGVLLKPGSWLERFFLQQATAIVVYIVLVGIIYNTILRFLWDPQGLQLIVNEILHLAIPVLFLLYWLVFIPKDELNWKNAFPWMIYPLIYGGFILIRGYFSDTRFYPYPFMDIGKIGGKQGLINTVGLILIFYVSSLLFIGIGKLLSRKKQ